jgi:hypothetical protein
MHFGTYAFLEDASAIVPTYFVDVTLKKYQCEMKY